MITSSAVQDHATEAMTMATFVEMATKKAAARGANPGPSERE